MRSSNLAEPTTPTLSPWSRTGRAPTGSDAPPPPPDEVAPAYVDLKTVALLHETLDEAWDAIPPEQQAGMLKATLAQRILKSAANGERDPERLREAALNPKHGVSAEW